MFSLADSRLAVNDVTVMRQTEGIWRGGEGTVLAHGPATLTARRNKSAMQTLRLYPKPKK